MTPLEIGLEDRDGTLASHMADSLLEVRDLARSFGGVRAVDGASFSVPRGQITGLIGPNGAGKSTVIGLMSGFVRPSGGRVLFDGRDVGGLSPHRIARRGLVRTFQASSEFPQLTVMENLLVAAPGVRGSSLLGALRTRRHWGASENERVENARALLAQFGLADAEDALAGELSGGQKRLLEITRGLMAKPKLLLLDEPFAGVNPSLARSIEQHLHALRADGLTMVLIEHEMGAVERLCDSVVVMAQGRVLTRGTMREIRENREVIDAYLAG